MYQLGQKSSTNLTCERGSIALPNPKGISRSSKLLGLFLCLLTFLPYSLFLSLLCKQTIFCPHGMAKTVTVSSGIIPLYRPRSLRKEHKYPCQRLPQFWVWSQPGPNQLLKTGVTHQPGVGQVPTLGPVDVQGHHFRKCYAPLWKG